MAEHPLCVEGVSKSFGEGASAVHAVREATFDVRAGEIVAIVGPSGSGKSTLLSMLGCLLTPTSGRITILGQDVTRLSQGALSAFRLRHIGFVFQSFNLLAALSARENIEIALNLAGTPGRRARERSSDLLEMLEIGGRGQMRPGNMSGGEQQRLAIGRALANRPDVILADEPTASLDSRAGRRVMELMRAAVDGGEAKSLVVVTHDTRILDLCQRVLQMEDGQVRERL